MLSAIDLTDYTTRERAITVCKLLRRALLWPVDVDMPGEAALFFAVIQVAICDAAIPPAFGASADPSKVASRSADGQSAVAYLSRRAIPHAEAIGLNTEYVHRLIREYDLFPLESPAHYARATSDDSDAESDKAGRVRAGVRA